ncbi:MAG: hypothetical protein IKU77_00165 [Alistipes sp.]|nr:hypothetical protein [Alistipes sp.]
MVAVVLCAVYLLGVGGTALSSLLCPCVELHQHSESCCHDHGHSHTDIHPLAAAHEHDWSLPCCDDRHSNRIQLYTANEDTERWAKVVVRNLPPMIFAEQPFDGVACLVEGGEKIHECVPRIQLCAVQPWALRAPPVLG